MSHVLAVSFVGKVCRSETEELNAMKRMRSNVISYHFFFLILKRTSENFVHGNQFRYSKSEQPPQLLNTI
jgi:hypothetical protein